MVGVDVSVEVREEKFISDEAVGLEPGLIHFHECYRLIYAAPRAVCESKRVSTFDQ